MQIQYNGYRHDVDLEAKIMDVWHVTEELSLINKAILDLEKPKSFYMHMIRGVIHLNETRFNCLEREWSIISGAFSEQNIEIQTNWNELFNDCFNIIKDVKILCEFLEHKELTTDQTTNIILGLETISNIKFERLFDEFSRLLKHINNLRVD